jgi:hypothetical protein
VTPAGKPVTFRLTAEAKLPEGLLVTVTEPGVPDFAVTLLEAADRLKVLGTATVTGIEIV